jgi:hypothetical protein
MTNMLNNEGKHVWTTGRHCDPAMGYLLHTWQCRKINTNIITANVFPEQADWTLTHTTHKHTEQSTIEASIRLDGVTLTDSLIRWSPNEWPSVCREIPQCLPIRCSGHLMSLHNKHTILQLSLLATNYTSRLTLDRTGARKKNHEQITGGLDSSHKCWNAGTDLSRLTLIITFNREGNFFIVLKYEYFDKRYE